MSYERREDEAGVSLFGKNRRCPWRAVPRQKGFSDAESLSVQGRNTFVPAAQRSCGLCHHTIKLLSDVGFSDEGNERPMQKTGQPASSSGKSMCR